VNYAILGEDSSDTATLAVLVRRLYAIKYPTRKVVPVVQRGYSGWAQLCRKGAREISALHKLGWRRFVVCIDADGVNPKPRYDKAYTSIVRKAKVPKTWLIIVPVQELEAWILADIEQVSNIIPSWHPVPITNPKGIASPKEHLRRLSRDPVNKYIRYKEAKDNPRMANHLRIEIVASKCRSFRSLIAFVRS